MKNGQRLFSGIYPCGIVFADRHNERHGDYARLAFLPYKTLKIEFERDCPTQLRSEIESEVERMNLKAGERFQISCAQYVILGT